SSIGSDYKINSYILFRILSSKISSRDEWTLQYWMFNQAPHEYITPHCCNAIISKSAQLEDFNPFRETYSYINSQNIADFATYRRFIAAAGNGGYFTEAREAFLEARGRNMADVVTYSSFITAAGNAGYFKEAQRAFLEAKEKGMTNVITDNSFITAAG